MFTGPEMELDMFPLHIT